MAQYQLGVPYPIPSCFNANDFLGPPEPNLTTDLDNDNLFPIDRVRFASRNPRSYEAIKPAFLLASLYITRYPQSFAMFISRKETNTDYVSYEDVQYRNPTEITSIIKSVIPYIDIGDSESDYAVAYLEEHNGHDLVAIDSKLVMLAMHRLTDPLVKFLALFMIAFLLCHELAHVLEFRIIREKKCLPSGDPFPSPPGITCGEVGVAWEMQFFGAALTPISAIDDDLNYIIGFAARSSAWNFGYMAVSNSWILQLFKKSFWSGDFDEKSVKIPFQPVLAVFPREGQSLKNEDKSDNEDDRKWSQSPTKRSRKSCTDVKIGKAPVKTRNHGHKGCGGKKFRTSTRS